jgi:hypothetical protein
VFNVLNMCSCWHRDNAVYGALVYGMMMVITTLVIRPAAMVLLKITVHALDISTTIASSRATFTQHEACPIQSDWRTNKCYPARVVIP